MLGVALTNPARGATQENFAMTMAVWPTTAPTVNCVGVRLRVHAGDTYDTQRF